MQDAISRSREIVYGDDFTLMCMLDSIETHHFRHLVLAYACSFAVSCLKWSENNPEEMVKERFIRTRINDAWSSRLRHRSTGRFWEDILHMPEDIYCVRQLIYISQGNSYIPRFPRETKSDNLTEKITIWQKTMSGRNKHVSSSISTVVMCRSCPMQPMRSKSSTKVMVRSCGRKAVLRPPLRDATSHRRRRWEKFEY